MVPERPGISAEASVSGSIYSYLRDTRRPAPNRATWNRSGSPMRNLLGRLHARRLPELLRIAAAWDIPLPVEGKDEVVSALYRALTDPRVVRDIWDRLDAGQRAMVLTLADAPEPAATPTLVQLAASLSVSEAEARETALGLYALGILAREGDDEPLAVGEAPRLMLPRELALQFRRIQDEMAAGDLARAPLRALIALLDDAELEGVARLWGFACCPEWRPGRSSRAGCYNSSAIRRGSSGWRAAGGAMRPRSGGRCAPRRVRQR
jgi:hypothetical protein